MKVETAGLRVAQRFVSQTTMGLRIIARYKEKKVVDSRDGGKTTVYIYSDKAIKKRDNDKAKRLQKLTGNIEKLRKRYKADLKSDDKKTALTALCVALMDETAERIGSEASAEGELNSKGDGHYGVSTFEKDHVTFSKGRARLKYTGKSGVKHNKEVAAPEVVKALKKAYDECVDGKIFTFDGGKVTPEDTNAYLADFDITNKDLRGYHANAEVRLALKDVRKKGGKLPEDKKERAKQLKAEWKEAIEIVAKSVGHTPSTLQNQYLTPGLQDKYLESGEIMDKMKA